MRILSIDPGKTSGFALLTTGEEVEVEVCDSVDTSILQKAAVFFLVKIREYKPDCLLVENYVVYESTAATHIGQQLHTAELIGVIEGVCGILIPPVPVIRVPASKKGRWPLARLNVWFPEHKQCPDDHARDALQLGLAYLEEV